MATARRVRLRQLADDFWEAGDKDTATELHAIAARLAGKAPTPTARLPRYRVRGFAPDVLLVARFGDAAWIVSAAMPHASARCVPFRSLEPQDAPTPELTEQEIQREIADADDYHQTGLRDPRVPPTPPNCQHPWEPTGVPSDSSEFSHDGE